MEKFTQLTGVAAPLDMINVDTDMVIPKQFLKTIGRTGLGPSLFFEMRYLDDGSENPDFVLNKPQYRDAKILIAGDNFGCGSSREHAPWSIEDCGFRVLIAPSFADIFYNNCFKNGMLPISLDESVVDDLFDRAAKHQGYQLTVDIETRAISDEHGLSIEFEVDDFRRHCLINALDDIDLTLEREPEITTIETAHGIV
ncbi:MAG: 3-isopropylmalate dehydratase small subunit [Oricola sp.]|nr:3-isopropylmalate dehydratase small subunit [Oricola sp.]